MTPDFENLLVDLPFLDKFLGFHAMQMSALLSHVEDAHRWTGGFPIPDTTRFRGTFINGKITEGTERLYNGKLRFYDVKHPERAIVIDLDHDRYEQLIVEVADLEPDAAIRTLLDYAHRAHARHPSEPPPPA